VTTEPVLLETIDDTIAVITLNRPDNRNAMTADLLQGVKTHAETVKNDPKIRCLIVRGTGSSFCSGADFKSTADASEHLIAHEQMYAMYDPFLSLTDLEIPTIACMNGHAIGGGFGLAIACDLRVARHDAKYGANFVRLGLHPGMATTYFFPRLMGVPKALELLLTGRIFSGAEAESIGLANYAVSAGEVWEKSLALAREIATAAPIAVRWTKRSVYENLDWQPRRAAYGEAVRQHSTAQTEDFKEGVHALLQKRPADFQGR